MAAQNLFPRTTEAGDLLDSAATLTFYLDPQGSTLAAIFTYPAKVAIPGAQVVTSATGVIPQFLGSVNGETVLYAKVGGGQAGDALLRVDGEPVMGTALGQPGGRSGAVKSTAGAAGDGQTVRQWTGKVALSTTVNLTVHFPVTGSADYTVPVGSTFYVTDIYTSGNSANQFDTQIMDGANPSFYGITKGDTAPIQLVGLETQPQIAGGDVMTLVFGPAVSATNAYYFISGFEQPNTPASY